MRSGVVTLLCLGGIVAVLTAGCAGRSDLDAEPAISGIDAGGARMRGCGPRPVPDILEQPSFDEARAAADIVFVGRMIHTDDPIPLTMKVAPEDLILDYGFEVDRIWGGEPADTLWVRSYREPSSGGISFLKGSVYLVYANREDGRLWTNRCTRTAMITASYADLYRLGEPDYDSESGLLPRMDRETLAREVRSPERATRVRALRIMERIAPENPDVVTAMIEAMSAHRGRDRTDFIAALGRLGPAGGPAVPELARMMDDEDAALRASAVASLGKIGMVDPQVLPELTDALKDEDPTVRASAAQAIGGLGSEAAAAAPALRELLTDPQPKVRDMASRALQLVTAVPR